MNVSKHREKLPQTAKPEDCVATGFLLYWTQHLCQRHNNKNEQVAQLSQMDCVMH